MSFFFRMPVGIIFWSIIGVGAVLSLTLANSGHAEVAITGTSDDARIEASSVALDQVLSDLRDKFGLSYTSSASLNNKSVNGTYTGPLRYILTRLLKEYDYALKTENGHISIIFTNEQKSAARPDPAGSATSATTRTSVASTSASGASETPWIKAVTNSTIEKAVPPTGALQPPASPKPRPVMVANFLAKQVAPFVSRGSTADSPFPLTESLNSGTSRAAIVQTTQRANLTLQALAGSLARLPQ